MHKAKALVAWMLLLACLMSAGGGMAASDEKHYETLADFAGMKIASQTGTVFDIDIDKVIDNVEHLYFNDLAAQALAVQNGTAAGVALDEPVGRLLVARQPGLSIFPELIAEDVYGFAFRQGDPLAEKASEIIERMQADGTSDEMAARWFSADESAKVLPVLDYKDDFDGSAGVLRFGYDPVVEPMVYLGEGNTPIGYDIEAMMRIAYELNMTLELVEVNISARIEALKAGTIDVAGCCLSITEERKKSVDFTVPYYIGGMVLVVRDDHMPPQPEGENPTIAYLQDKKVGILTGTVFDKILSEMVPDAQPEFYNTQTDMREALSVGHIDAFLLDEPMVRVLISRSTGLRMLPDYLTREAYAIMFNKEHLVIRDAFNQVLATLEADGTLARLEEKWFSADERDYVPADLTLTGEKGTLHLVVEPSSEPFSFVQGGEIVGLDVDIVRTICSQLGYGLEVTGSDFSGLLAGILSGKYDMGAGCISVTEEREKQAYFTTPTYHGGVVAVARDENAVASTIGFWEGIRESFQNNFVKDQRYRLILDGLWMTVKISVLSVIFGTVLGFGLCMARRSRSRILQALAGAFIRIVQGVPMMVILLILAYVVFKNARFDSMWVAVIGFSINFAAYAAEIMRTGINAVDPGQLEAASALGFGKAKIFTLITFPQAARHSLPVYKSEIISMVKASSIVGYIAIMDLTKASDLIRSRTFDAFFPLLVTAAIYFLLANLLISLLGLVERRIDPKWRKRQLKGVTLHD